MEDKINKIWYQMNMKEITSEQARQQVLDLFAVSGQLEALRKDFCLWYYAQSQPLDAHKVLDWFASNFR